MASDIEGAGFGLVEDRQVLEISASQLGAPNLLASPEETPRAKDRVFTSNDDLWRMLLSEQIRSTATVHLDGFWLSEWFPLRPGLFHTEIGREARKYADRGLLTGPEASPGAVRMFSDYLGRDVPTNLLERFNFQNTYVYSPWGKGRMLAGGIGCIRLKPKLIGGREEAWFMGATSEPYAHQGIPVALPNHLYQEVIDQIASQGALYCRLTGQLRVIPPDLDPLYRHLIGIPQLYVQVDRITKTTTSRDQLLVADGAVLVDSPHRLRGELNENIYGAYVSFNPGEAGAVTEAARRLADIYVGEILQGRVLTDFDEQVPRFNDAIFSLDLVMRGLVPTSDAELLLRRLAPGTINLFTQRIQTVNGVVNNLQVQGSNNIVAGAGGAAAGAGGVAAAGGSAAAGTNSTANVGQPLAKRVKKSRWAQVFGVIALLITIATTILLIMGKTDIGLAGYVLAVVAVLIGVIPIMRAGG